ncbi:uncharacterized protein RBU57_005654 isoform 1-T3 [Macrochelys suwanniensis]
MQLACVQQWFPRPSRHSGVDIVMELSKDPRGFAGTWVHQLHCGFDADLLQYKGYPEISDWLLVGSSQRYRPVLARMDNRCCSGDNVALPDIPAPGTWIPQVRLPTLQDGLGVSQNRHRSPGDY